MNGYLKLHPLALAAAFALTGLLDALMVEGPMMHSMIVTPTFSGPLWEMRHWFDASTIGLFMITGALVGACIAFTYNFVLALVQGSLLGDQHAPHT